MANAGAFQSRDSFWWTAQGDPTAVGTVSAGAVLVLACDGLARRLSVFWKSRAVPVAGVLSLLAAPLHGVAALLRSAHPGVLVLLGGFLMFGLGTALALTKHRWSAGKTGE